MPNSSTAPAGFNPGPGEPAHASAVPPEIPNGNTPRPRVEYAPGWTDRIPAELKERPQWVVWRFEWRTDKTGAGKWTKVPYQPRTVRGRRPKAKADTPATWGTFAEALAAYQANADRDDAERLDGIGYEFATDDEFAGVDLDDCLTADGELLGWADGWLDRLGPTYAEVSPSGSGIKAFYRGHLPAKPDGRTGRRRAGYGPDGAGEIEAYDRGRYFALTGARWWDDHATIAGAEAGALADLAAELDAGRKGARKGTNGKAETNGKAPAPTEPPPVVDPGRKATIDQFSDDDLLKWARNAKNGAKFSALYDAGDCSGHPSGSEADSALLVMLAYWTGADAARMERLFDGSALARRDKWAERPDYRARSIISAIEFNQGKAPDLTEWTFQDGVFTAGKKPPPEQPRRAPAGGAEANGQPGADGHHATNGDGRGGPASDKAPTLDEHLSRRPRSDLGNAERLVARHGHDLRYCHPWKSWFVWDGRRWRLDDTGEVRRRACNTVRAILAEAATQTDDDRRKELALWALASEKRDRIGAMVHLAEVLEGIPILHEAMDVDPWAFNCLNGTVDLRTGELRPHRRDDLITKLCPLEFDPAAPCTLWIATLEKFFDRADADRKSGLIDYWQRLCGYASAGVIRDHVMPVAYGTGSNGKSTILGALLDVFGADYAMKAPPDMFMAKKTDSHPTDRADLFRKRLVVAIETEAGRRLNETMIKELTGGDRVRARRMHENFWEFSPTHTVIMATNHKPGVRGNDNGIWRRLKLVPFTVSVDDRNADKAMPDKLRAEAAGILAWCVRGCLEWQRRGLDAPPDVTEATAGYRAEQDSIGLFLDECAERGPSLKVRAGDLYGSYAKWAAAGNEHVVSQKLFGPAIEEKGIEKKTSNGVWYLGIGLRTPDDDLAKWLKARIDAGALSVRDSIDAAGAAGLLRRKDDGKWEPAPLWEAGRRLGYVPTKHTGGKVWGPSDDHNEGREGGEI